MIDAAPKSLNGDRVVLASLDVHDLMRDVLIDALTTLGTEVVVLAGDSHPHAVIAAAVQEDADSVIVSTYNGAALSQARRLASSSRDLRFDGPIFMGGVLNEDTGDGLPVDVCDQVGALGIHCVDQITDLPALMARGSDGNR